MSPALITGLIIAVAVAILGMMVWSVQRIITRLDFAIAGLYELKSRVDVIESKQDAGVELAARADKIGRKTAAKVGVRLPKDLTDTIDPKRLVHQ